MNVSLAAHKKIINNPNYKWFAYITIAIGIGLAVLDQSGTNIAIPEISEYFQIDIPTAQWLTLGYILTTSALFLPMGRLADIVGKKYIYISGFIAFIIGASLGGFSNSYPLIIMAKVIQGVGGACIQANGMAMVTGIFPENERGKALGLYMTIIGTGAICGPIIGGILVTELGWRSIFFASIPVSIIAFVMGVLVLKSETKTYGGSFSFDWLGALISALALISLLFGITSIHKHEFFTLPVFGSMALGVSLIGIFIAWEKTATSPMLELRFFRTPDFSIGTLTRFLAFVAGSSIFFLMPFYLIQVLRYEPSMAGILMIPSALCMAISSPVSGRLSDKLGTKWISMAGLLLMALSMAIFSQLTLGSGPIIIMLAMCLNGTGMGTFSSPNTSAIMGSLSTEDHGIASALMQLTRTTANLIGIAIATLIVTVTMSAAGFKPDLAQVSQSSNKELLAFSNGLSISFVVSGFLLIIGFFLTAFRSRKI